MIVSIKFMRSNVYTGREYSYETDLALLPGDKVLVPAGAGKNKAMVVAIHVPESMVDARYFPLKVITERDTEDAMNG